MRQWERALSRICELCNQSESPIEWLLVGSAGSVLQGCEMEPGDIDIYIRNSQDVQQFAELLRPFSLASRSEFSHGEQWLSSLEEPTFTQTFGSGFSWTKGRWIIDDFTVEAVHISNSAGIPDSMEGDGIWEGGQYIWSLCNKVQLGDFTMAAVPLEIQLESNLRRKRKDRVQSIIHAMQQGGYDKELVEKALSKENLAYFYTMIS